MNFVCETCQAPFTASTSRKYCSRDCYYESERGKPSPLKGRGLESRNCQRCGESFVVGGQGGRKKTSLYCSRACSAAAHRVDKGKCLQCGEPLTTRGKHTYCSSTCYRTAMRSKTNERTRDFVCARCGKEFQRYVSQRRGKAVYCSGECRAAGRVYATGQDHPQWKGGTHLSNGYVIETDYSRRRGNGEYARKFQHIRIAEETLGRPLENGEHVHHMNGNKLDNRPENLLILPNSQHRKLHSFYAQQFQSEHAVKGDLLDLTRAFLDSL